MSYQRVNMDSHLRVNESRHDDYREFLKIWNLEDAVCAAKSKIVELRNDLLVPFQQIEVQNSQNYEEYLKKIEQNIKDVNSELFPSSEHDEPSEKKVKTDV